MQYKKHLHQKRSINIPVGKNDIDPKDKTTLNPVPKKVLPLLIC